MCSSPCILGLSTPEEIASHLDRFDRCCNQRAKWRSILEKKHQTYIAVVQPRISLSALPGLLRVAFQESPPVIWRRPESDNFFLAKNFRIYIGESPLRTLLVVWAGLIQMKIGGMRLLGQDCPSCGQPKN